MPTESKVTRHGNTLTVNEDITEAEAREQFPVFFENPMGRDETITMYRGAIISQSTDEHCSDAPKVRTAVHLIVTADEGGEHWASCVSSGRNIQSIDDAQEAVDEILEAGAY